MQRWSRPRRRRSIALTPLIDVVFLLLIFFVMAGRFSDEARLVLAAPASTAAETEEAVPMMLIQVNAAGELQLLGQRIEAMQLAASKPDDASIVLRLDPDLPLAGMVNVIDQLKDAGIENLSYWPEDTP